jgi:hypothetical protein
LQILEQNIAFLTFKVENNHFPKKLFLFFAEISPAIFFGGSDSSTLKQDSQRPLGPIPTFLFPGGVMGKIF